MQQKVPLPCQIKNSLYAAMTLYRTEPGVALLTPMFCYYITERKQARSEYFDAKLTVSFISS